MFMVSKDAVKLNLLFDVGCWFIDALPMLIPPPVVPPLLKHCCLKSCCLNPRSCSRLSDDRWRRRHLSEEEELGQYYV